MRTRSVSDLEEELFMLTAEGKWFLIFLSDFQGNIKTEHSVSFKDHTHGNPKSSQNPKLSFNCQFKNKFLDTQAHEIESTIVYAGYLNQG